MIFSFVFTPAILPAQAEPAGEEPAEEEPAEREPSGSSGNALRKLKTVGGGAYGVAESTIPKQPVEIVGGIIKIGLNIVGLIFLALMIYGGFLWMTARGEEAKVTKSKELLEAAIIGLVIVFAAYGITYFVVNQLMTNVISGGGAV